MKVPIIVHGAWHNLVFRLLVCCFAASVLFFTVNNGTVRAQNVPNIPAAVDPGPRPGPQPATGAGNPIPGLPANQVTFWFDGLGLFGETVSVKGTIAGEPLSGLGPAFNGNSCFLCHSQPAIGGSSEYQSAERDCQS